MTKLVDYQESFRNIRLERREGVLQVTLHTRGGPLQWGADRGSIHDQLAGAFYAIAHDDENRVMILTGSGDAFCRERNASEYSDAFSPEYWYRIMREGRDMLTNLLEIDVPVISAINGPALIHSELPVLADIVLATDDTVFRDTHMGIGVVPGDGCHSIWNHLLGGTRGHYYLLTSEKLSVQDAYRFGVVHEVLARERLLERAWEIARKLASKPLMTLRYSRLLFSRPMRDAIQRDLSFGLALEGLSVGALPAAPIPQSKND